MKVRVVSVSEPRVDGLESAEELVAYAARVSNPSNQLNVETAPKLVKYLLRNSHFSPFEMVSITIEIETTRDIARQILRHCSFRFQEFSTRYADPTKALGFVLRDARMQDLKNRQNSIEITPLDGDRGLQLKDDWVERQEKLVALARETYEWAIGKGIAKEQARSVLPEGLLVSRLYMAGSLRSWIHYCGLRSGNGTQREHQEVARACWDLIAKEFPSVAEAVEEMRVEEERRAREEPAKVIPVPALVKPRRETHVGRFVGWMKSLLTSQR